MLLVRLAFAMSNASGISAAGVHYASYAIISF